MPSRAFSSSPVLVDEVLGDVAVVELRRALDAPAVERGADRLGVLEPGDVVAAEAAEPADRLLAEVHQLLVLRELRRDEVVDLAERDRDRLAVPLDTPPW